MWPILFCSVLASAVFLERAHYFHRISLKVGELMRGLANLLRGRAGLLVVASGLAVDALQAALDPRVRLN